MFLKIFRATAVMCALAACLAYNNAQAALGVGQSDPFSLYFDENGNATIDLRDGTGLHSVSGFAQVDPNTGRNALTYPLPNEIGSGIVQVLDPSGALSDAISFYNIGVNGFMAYYSTTGPDLADTISGGFVPTSSLSVTEVGDSFAFYSGGVPLANNDYYGISAVPEPSTCIAGALLLLPFGLRGIRSLRRRAA